MDPFPQYFGPMLCSTSYIQLKSMRQEHKLARKETWAINEINSDFFLKKEFVILERKWEWVLGEQKETTFMRQESVISFECWKNDYQIHISPANFHCDLSMQIPCSAYLVAAAPNKCFSTGQMYIIV